MHELDRIVNTPVTDIPGTIATGRLPAYYFLLLVYSFDENYELIYIPTTYSSS